MHPILLIRENAMCPKSLEELTPPTSLHLHDEILAKLKELYGELYAHNGFGQLRLEIRFLKRGQKEVLINCGKEYRYVVDYLSRDGE
jgi:hypothetical protein